MNEEEVKNSINPNFSGVSPSYNANASFGDVITSNDFQARPSLVLPERPKENLAEYSAAIASATPSLPAPVETPVQDIVNKINSKTAAETTQEGFTQRMSRILDSLRGKTHAQQKAEEVSQVPVFEKQLTDINSQIIALANEAKAIPLQIQEEFRGSGATRSGLAPIETSRLRENAIKSLTLSSAAAAIQGNLALAQNQADRAVALEFAPQEKELDFLQKQYELNKDTLEREDKKKADALAIQLEERKRRLEEGKTNRTEILKIANAAALAGAPSTVLQRISLTQNPLEAVQFASPYLGIEQELQNDLTRQKIDSGEKVIDSTGTVSGDLQSIITKYTSQKNVPAQLKTQLTKGLNIINKLDSMIASSPEGKFAGASPGQRALQFIAPEFLTPKSTTGFAADEAKLRQDLVTYITGAAYTTLQADDVNKIIPRTSLTDPKNQQRIEKLYNTVIGDIQSALTASGFNAQLPRVSNIFQGTDKYAQYRNQLNEGEILVQRGDEIVAITPEEIRAGDIEI